MQRWIYFCLMLIGLTGCRAEKVYHVPMEPSVYLTTLDISTIVLNFADPYKDDHVYLHSSYANMCDDTGRFTVWLDFYTQKLLDLEGARRLMVEMSQGLLRHLNGYIYNNPSNAEKGGFTYNDLYISVEFESYFGKYVDPLYVGRMELKDGYFNAFYAHTALDPKSIVFHQHFEPYETSVHIIDVENEIAIRKGETVPSESKSRFHEIFQEVIQKQHSEGWVN